MAIWRFKDLGLVWYSMRLSVLVRLYCRWCTRYSIQCCNAVYGDDVGDAYDDAVDDMDVDVVYDCDEAEADAHVDDVAMMLMIICGC